ncbi:MAG: DUF2388 domain-containing protein [Lysobacter sp.]
MTQLRLLAVAALLGLSPAAAASTFYTISDAVSESVGSISDGTSGTSGSFSDDKVVLAARDDAASFVASDGAIRGAHLEAAFLHVRERLPAAREASDGELARAILAP